MNKDVVRTSKAPNPIGPYSQAVRVGNLVFTAGQGPTNPATGQLVSGDIKAQARQVLENIKAILEAAGTSLDNVVKATCFLRDMNDFAAFNEVYAAYFNGDSPPARTTVQAARLPRDIAVEIDTVAVVPD